MSAGAVRRAARKAFFAETGSQGPPRGVDEVGDRQGTGGIGCVLRVLHDPVVKEPLPPDMAALLGALEKADRRSSL